MTVVSVIPEFSITFFHLKTFEDLIYSFEISGAENLGEPDILNLKPK